MHRLLRHVALLFCAGATLACHDTAAGPRALRASATSLSFDDAHTSTTVSLEGVSGAWRVATRPTWLVVTPDHGGADSASLTLSVPGLNVLTPGKYSGSVVVTSGDRTVAIDARATVIGHPAPTLGTGDFDFGTALDTASLPLANVGNTSTAWHLSSDVPWVTLAPASGQLERDAETTVRIVVDRSQLPAGEHTATISLGGDGIPATTSVRLHLIVPAAPMGTFDLQRIVFPADSTRATVGLRNSGRATLTWSIARQPAWMTVQPSSGTLDPGAMVALTATADRATAPAGVTWVADSLVLETNAAAASLPVTLVRDAPHAGTLWPIDVRVADAVFDHVNERILILSADTPELFVVDARRGVFDRIPLAEPGRFVTLSADGRRAAVTHTAYATVIDMPTMRVIGRYGTGGVMRVALSNLGKLYAFPVSDEIRSIDIFTGAESKAPGQIYGSVGWVLPTGSFVLSLNSGGVQSWSVRGDELQLLGETDYRYGGDFWLDQSGARLVVATGAVFDVGQTGGLTRLGSLPGTKVIGAFDHSLASNRYYIVPESPGGTWDLSWPYRGEESTITVIDASSRAVVDSLAIPGFDVVSATGTRSYPAAGRFVFASAKGDRVYALVEAPAEAGLAHPWAIATFDVGGAP